jgi:hypothetical protein
MQPVLTYNQELAAKAGGGDFLNQGGAYICKITEAKFVTAKTGSSGIEFSIETKEGQKANYISVYYAKKSESQGVAGEPISGGLSCLNAIMGVLGAKQMTAVKKGEGWHCQEFEGAEVGFFLQKKLTSKSDGSDSYGFEIKVPFCPKTRRTMREIIESKPAQTIDRMESSYADINERKSGNAGSSQAANVGQGSPYPDGW